MQAGKLIVITGPSGVGKGTLVRAIRELHPELFLSISVTTRQPRQGEIDGKDYYFVNREKFERMVEAGELLEWAEYAGNYYGTPRLQVLEKIKQGSKVILEIELTGARIIKKTCPDALFLFILPPSIEELELRLRKRGQDSNMAIARRLEKATLEMAAKDEFDCLILNENFETALNQLEEAIFKQKDN